MTEIPTGPDGKGPKLYLASVIDLYSRRLLGAATGLHPDAELACAAIKMAVTARGGKAAIWRQDEAERVVFHTDRGSTGGFNWSSQHLDIGGVCRGEFEEAVAGATGGRAAAVGRRQGAAAGDAVAGPSGAVAGCAA